MVFDDAEMPTSEMHDPYTRKTVASKIKQHRNTFKGAPVWSRPNTLRRLSQKTLLQL